MLVKDRQRVSTFLVWAIAGLTGRGITWTLWVKEMGWIIWSLLQPHSLPLLKHHYSRVDCTMHWGFLVMQTLYRTWWQRQKLIDTETGHIITIAKQDTEAHLLTALQRRHPKTAHISNQTLVQQKRNKQKQKNDALNSEAWMCLPRIGEPARTCFLHYG